MRNEWHYWPASLGLLIILILLSIGVGSSAMAQQFTDIGANLPRVGSGEATWGDYDSDGDLDFILIGSTRGQQYISGIYRNDGSGIFTDIGVDLGHIMTSSPVWGDYDNDGDLDILLTGSDGSNYFSRVYRNDSGAFVDIGANLIGVSDSAAWGDYDNDGDIDILLTGYTESAAVSKIYRNDGGGVFTDIGVDLVGVSNSSVAWGDYDNDGDLDIVLTGVDSSLQSVTKIYRNDGQSVFIDIGASLPNVAYGSVAWGDYDNDGDLDILLAGFGNSILTRVYRNDGNGVFTNINANLTGIGLGSVAWGDYDNDGDLDILLTGSAESGGVSRIYRYDDNGVFVDIIANLIDVGQGSAAWGDYDSDGDLDILLMGYVLGSGTLEYTKIYRNNATVSNTVPTSPTGLNTPFGSDDITLNWNAASDSETLALGLTYNLRVSTTPGGVNMLSPMASVSAGLRRVPQMGNAQHGTTAIMKSFPPGTYYWSVQAIDTAFTGSPFAEESTFSVCSPAISPTFASFRNVGGSGTIDITDGQGCPWTATSSNPWITITSPSNGSGSGYGNVTYSVAANPTGPSRTGGISIDGQTLTVNQEGLVVFTETGWTLSDVTAKTVAWGDYDNDGNLDILLTGSYYGSMAMTRIYRNIGNGSFSGLGTALTDVSYGSVAWGDYDNDGDLDVALSGRAPYQYISRIYRNDGNGVFTDIYASLTGTSNGSLAWGDYDNDGDLDLLLTGYSDFGLISRIFRNNGNGLFSDIGANLIGVLDSSVAWGDFDNDGDLDILLTGSTSDNEPISRVYRNDGNGVFTDINASLRGVAFGSVAWGDYDNDGDLDILLTGFDGSAPVTKIYRNDGGGVFNDIGAGLINIDGGCVAWGDYDNDGDLDILMTGYSFAGRATKIYRNEGGGFIDIGANLPAVGNSSAAWGDFDNDGDLDILLSGTTGDSQRLTKIYRNDGAIANMVPLTPTGLNTPVGGGEVTLSWTPASDAQTPSQGLTYNLRVSTTPGGSNILSPMASTTTGLRTVPQMGNAQLGTTALIKLLSPGTYYWSVQAIDTAFAGSPFSNESTLTICSSEISPTSVIFSKHGGDGIVNVIAAFGCAWTAMSSNPWITITSNSSGEGNGVINYSVAANSANAMRVGALTIAGHTFTVNQGGQFADIGSSLPAVDESSVAWGDYDNDGDLDILLAGFSSLGFVSKIFRNDGNGVFTDTGASLPGVWDGSVAWGDYDNDGNLDILLTGRSYAGTVAKIYRNSGNGVFTDIQASLTGVGDSAVAWGDYDNDGDLDILLTGMTSGNVAITRIYRNDGGGMFSDIGASLQGVERGSASWGDFDNDGDLDILLTGYSGSELISRIYRNCGDGIFSDIVAGLPGVYMSDAAWGDYDNDGDLDILLTGYSYQGLISKVYRNDGNGAFTDIGANLTGVYWSSLAWGDYDNDGDLDILLTGYTNAEPKTTKIYRNDGASSFTDLGANLTSISFGSVAWGDFDNDGDLDILLTGEATNNQAVTRIYRNDGTVANSAPTSPTGLDSPSGAGQITLNWASASDSETPSPGLTYNLRVSTSPGGVNILSPMASTGTGLRRLPQMGNAQHGTTSVINVLTPGTYYWSVQAIDTGFAGSPFANESTFTVCSAVIDPTHASFGSAGGGGIVSVAAAPGCAWVATTSTPSWISISSGGSGNGSGSVAYTVSAAQGPSRTGTITIAGRIFTVSQDGVFSDTGANLPNVAEGSVAWGDYDNDGDLDILLTGYANPGMITRIYRNDGIGVFVDIGAGLPGVSDSSVAWGDYDNDGDLDILLTGQGNWGALTRIYRNDGGGLFVDILAHLPGVMFSSVAWGDLDNDGDLDILLTGNDGNNRIANIYRNDGNGVFSDSGAILTIVSSGSVALGDFDNDGDLDILLSGLTNSGGIANIYRNDGNFAFVDILAGLPGVGFSSVAWGDYDNDGDLDFVLTGYSGSSTYITKIYRNDHGVFTANGASLVGVTAGSVAWGDADNDGDLDVLVTGSTNTTRVAKIYRNDGGEVFTDTQASLIGVSRGSAAWGDFDNDGDLDLLVTGEDSNYAYFTRLYRNNISISNSVPAIPTGLDTPSCVGTAVLRWNPASDDKTPSSGLTYNVRLATTTGGINVLSPMSAIGTGRRLLPQMGNAQHGVTAVITSLSPGTYYWSVQAVDSLFAGSPFASESTFTVCDATINPTFANISVSGGPGGIDVTTEGSCTWTVISSNPSWLTITSGASGTGSGSTNFVATVNNGPARTGRITIAGRTFIVNQEGRYGDYGTNLPGLTSSAVAWGDYDNDGDLDILLTGDANSGPMARVYRNDGGVFNDIRANIAIVHWGSGAWGDYDNDGDLDILLTGNDGSRSVVKIYRNDGSSVFTDIGEPIPGYSTSSVAWGDYDNDGDLDILLATSSGTRIFRNAGGGVFTDVGAGLAGVYLSSLAWGDYDNDDDLDILLSGYNGWASVTKVYRNDNGVFTDIAANLTPVNSGSVAWGDYDNDGDLDILLTGFASGGRVSKIYRNDGGVFNDAGVSLPGVGYSAAAWGDVDNDGDLDILLTGNSGTARVAKIFSNIGGGAFSDVGAPLVGVERGAVAWGDFDNDGDLDLMITGWTGTEATTKIYRNNGLVPNSVPAAPTGLNSPTVPADTLLSWTAASDSMTPSAGLTYNLRVATTPGGVDILSPMAVTGSGLRQIPQLGNAQHGVTAKIKSLPPGTYYWSVQAVDTSFAGGPFASESSFTVCSLAISPENARFDRTGGTGTVTITADEGCPWTATSIQSWITIDSPVGGSGIGSGSIEFHVEANVAVGTRTGKITIADHIFDISQYGLFADTGANLEGVVLSSVAWGDYDNDGHLDLVASGLTRAFEVITRVYHNDGSSGFTDLGANLVGVQAGSVAWGDYDNDNHLDILLAGSALSGSVAKIYHNDGNGAFTDIGANLIGVAESAVAWGDFDNDGDLDIILTGRTGTTTRTSKIYRNDGGGIFSDIGAGLVAVSSGSVAWGDFDNDGDLDLLLTGYDGSVNVAKIYRNNGNGGFSDLGTILPGVEFSSVAWGDYDNDGDLDFVLSGNRGPTDVATIYRNDGNGLFTDIGANLLGAREGSAAWGDFDNDGDLDLLLVGMNSSQLLLAKIYRNDPNSVFTDIGASLGGVRIGAAAWGDADSDGDLDILITGERPSGVSSFETVAKLYCNDGTVANSVPNAPTNLYASLGTGQVILNWTGAIDNETPAAGLNYNLRISTTPGGVSILSPMASTIEGYRRVPRLGNAQTGTRALIKSLPPGAYFWSVQAIDAAFAGGPFATESSFSICSYAIDPTSTSVGAGGGTGDINVTAVSGCAWTAVSNDTWIHVTSGDSGTGNGSVAYAVDANTGAARIGSITIAGKAFTINQAVATYNLSIDKTGTGTGTVASNPAGIECGITCSANYNFNQGVTLTAKPDIGSTFVGWSGGGCSGTGTCTVTMTGARDVTAQFDLYRTAFYTLTPCRVLDTRSLDGPLGGPILAANSTRMFTVVGQCGIPITARALSVNLTSVNATLSGELQVIPGDLGSSQTSTISFSISRARANNAIVSLATNESGTISVTNISNGTVHLILDVNGYFE